MPKMNAEQRKSYEKRMAPAKAKETEEKAEADAFDYRPLIPGTAVPMHLVAMRRGPNGEVKEGRLEFAMAGGEGEVDGVEFYVQGTVGCNLIVRFKRKDAAGKEVESDANGHAYQINARDLIEAAWALDKVKPARAP